MLVLTEDHSYSEAEQEELLEIVGRIEVVTRQASVTTSERIRQMYMHMGERLGPELGQGPARADRRHPARGHERPSCAYIPVLHEGYRRFLARPRARTGRCT